MLHKILPFIFCLIICSCSISKSPKKAHEELMLNGKTSREELKKNFTWFDVNYTKYIPNDTAINELKSFSKNLKVVVIMGTWCSDSKEHIPQFFKVADAINLNESQIEIIAVDRKKKSSTIDITPFKIEYVPTFIFFKDGKQIGSIIETPHETIEKDWMRIIRVMK
jgi:thiol-disulfide isomerase/thioredoxin